MSGRPGLFVALFGLAAIGATCKGGDQRGESPNTPPAPPAAPAVKAPAVTEMEGVDLALIDPSLRGDALRILNETFCYCGCARTVAACLANKANCSCVKCSSRMADFIISEYRSGATTEDVEAQLLEGFSEGFNGRELKFEEKDQPQKGPADAPFTIIEFADFRCPHCAAAFSVLDDLVKQRQDIQLRYYYFPLNGGGERSIRAAEAGEAAKAQGKFWEMAKLMFENQHALEDADLSTYAKQAGLDVGKFEKALKDGAHRPKVMENKRLGETVGVQSTPAVYINGRPFGLARTLENFQLRLEMEADRGRCD
ncbi:MAG: thioredoxin domain-containing protein [Deltaproteobacteria bacterium]|jgi:protein-disulfide isomerase|nr:thioredoxin domain-containing protein [Deltaproteobacteria bacterium]